MLSSPASSMTLEFEEVVRYMIPMGGFASTTAMYGVHNPLLPLPDGYDTWLSLCSGHCQKIELSGNVVDVALVVSNLGSSWASKLS